MNYSRIEVQPLAGALGAEVFGVDLRHELDRETLAEIRCAFLEYLVIFFRDQRISDGDLARFGRSFGELAPLPPHRQLPGRFPELLVIDKQPADKLVFGWEWHSDTTHLEVPSLGSILLGKIIPPVGGDTLFANQYMAYDTLSGGMKAALEKLNARHGNGRILMSLEQDEVLPPADARAQQYTTAFAVHPVVRTHPETGKKALFVNELHTERFEDMTYEESQPLLAFLYRHSTRPEFTCRFRWREGSIAFWDNRCCQHLALNDYPGERRLMHRVQVKGTRPR
jgi:taurine dioxygenase